MGLAECLFCLLVSCAIKPAVKVDYHVLSTVQKCLIPTCMSQFDIYLFLLVQETHG